jgi:D-lyxose ketol-isomerase
LGEENISFLDGQRVNKFVVIKENKIKTEKKENVIEIQDEVKISQEGKDVILEKGDKIRILKEAKYHVTWGEYEDVAQEIFDALEDYGLDVTYDYSSYERVNAIQLRLFRKTFELALAVIS